MTPTDIIKQQHAINGYAVEPCIVANMLGARGYHERSNVKKALEQAAKAGDIDRVLLGTGYGYVPAGECCARVR